MSFSLLPGVYRLADAHSCHQLQHAAEGFLHSHFLQVKNTDEFFALPKDDLVHLLSSEFIKVEDEFQVRWENVVRKIIRLV